MRELAGQVLRAGTRVGTGAVARIEELLRESQRPAAERVQGMVGYVIGEAALSHEPHQLIVIAQDRHAHGGARLKDARCPGVAKEYLPGGQDALPDGALPAPFPG